MKAQKQIINRLTIKYEEGLLNNKQYFQTFYLAFCIASVELEKQGLMIIDNKLLEHRNNLYKYINCTLVNKAVELSHGDNSKVNAIYQAISDKYIRQLQDLVRSDSSVINYFNSVFEQIQIEEGEMGDLETEDSIGIAEFEFSE